MRHHSWSICTYTLLETCSTFKHLFVWHASNAVYCLVNLRWMDYFLGCIEKQVDFHHIITLQKLPTSRKACLFSLVGDLPISYISQADYVKRMWQGCRKWSMFDCQNQPSRFVRGLVACRIKVKAYNNVHKQDRCLDTCHCLDWQCFRS